MVPNPHGFHLSSEICFVKLSVNARNLPIADNYLAISGNRNRRNGNGVLITMWPRLLQTGANQSVSTDAFAEKF